MVDPGGGAMDGGIGLVGARAEVADHVSGLAAELGVAMHVVDAADVRPGGGVPHRLRLVDGCGPGVAGGEQRGEGGGALRGEGGGRTPPGRGASGGRTAVVHLAGERTRSEAVAGRWGADALVELPVGRAWLAGLLAGAAAPSVLAVVGAVGGAGATSVAIGCAAAAVPDCLLVDADPGSPGLDLPLGIPAGRGGRWESVPDTGEPLVADSLRAALPRLQGISVLTGVMPDPAGGRLGGAVAAGRSSFRRTVVDCGRTPLPVPVSPGDPVALVTPATLAGVVSSRRVLAVAAPRRVVLVVRPTGWLPVDEVADMVGAAAVVPAPRLARLADSLECGEVLRGRVGRELVRLGGRIWAAAQ